MTSARQDRLKGGIDKLAGRLLEFFGRLTGKRSTRVKGKAAHARGTGRTAKGRLKGSGRRMGVLRGLGAVVGGLLAGVFGLLRGVLVGVGSLLRRLF